MSEYDIGREPARKQRGRIARYARRTAFTVLGVILFAVIAFGVAYIFTPVPDASSASTAAGSVFYYSDGKTPIARKGMNRVLVALSKVPEPVQEAVVAAENRSFYTDPGVSVKGTARAMWSTLSGGQVQGGSTITQQMVRNYYSGITQQRSVFRKLKEIMVSLKVGEEKSKDWILQQYLNTIYFGRDAYGIQAAAQAYYGVNVQQLTPAQGAYLAAAIQQPSVYADPSDPAVHAAAVSRWRYVVDGMVQMHAISAEEAARLKFPNPIKFRLTDVFGGEKGYMVAAASQELIRQHGYSENEIDSGGLKIVTTFDKHLMKEAEQTVQADMPTGTSPQVLTGLVTVNPANGAVVAFYGGSDYVNEPSNSAFDGYAQAGSGFKPYVLAAALDDGYGLDTTLDGSSPQYFGGHQIENDNNDSYGQVNLVSATANSINTAYVGLGQQVGLDRVTSMAESLGIPAAQLTANGANTAVSFPLGVASVSPLQQAGAYAAFADGGVYHPTHVIQSITTPDGQKVKINEPGTRVFSQQVADDATYAMTKVVEYGTGTRAGLDDGRPVAGKTGTTTAGAALWFNGYIPQLVTSVGIFRADTKPVVIPGYTSYGGSLPAQIWHDYMTTATQDLPPKDFGSPSISFAPTYPTWSPTPHSSQPPSTQGPTGPTAQPTPGPPLPSVVPTINPTHILPTGLPTAPTRPPAARLPAARASGGRAAAVRPKPQPSGP